MSLPNNIFDLLDNLVLDNENKIKKKNPSRKHTSPFEQTIESHGSKVSHYTNINTLIISNIKEEYNIDLTYRQGLPNTQSNINKIENTQVSGHYKCVHKKSKPKTWVSGKVFVEIKAYQQCFEVLVYKQCCKSCNSMRTPSLDIEIYVERVTSKLLVMLGLCKYIKYKGDKKKRMPPHIMSHCEGCKAGKCDAGRSNT